MTMTNITQMEAQLKARAEQIAQSWYFLTRRTNIFLENEGCKFTGDLLRNWIPTAPMASVAGKIEKIRNHAVSIEERLTTICSQAKFLYLAIENADTKVRVNDLLTEAEASIHPDFLHVLPTKTKQTDGTEEWKAFTLTDICSYLTLHKFTPVSVRGLSNMYERYVLEGQGLIDVSGDNLISATDPSEVGRPESFRKVGIKPKWKYRWIMNSNMEQVFDDYWDIDGPLPTLTYTYYVWKPDHKKSTIIGPFEHTTNAGGRTSYFEMCRLVAKQYPDMGMVVGDVEPKGRSWGQSPF